MAVAEDKDTTAPKAAGSRFKVAKVAFSTDPVAEEDDDKARSNDVNDNSAKNERSDLRVEIHPATPSKSESETPQPTSPYGETHTYTDTHNLKTFGHNTHEALPHDDHYRNLLSATHALRVRPTLEELHGDKMDDEESSDVENGGVDAKETKTEIQTTGVPRFGWIKGVLIRCLLNIWGVMLFIRLSWVVGQAGLPLATLIILMSAVVTLITAMSMSAICTNGVVRGGGVYFMISRSLGPEFGGAIGIIFALANAVAVAMYVVGFAETVRDVMHAHGAVMVDPLNDLRILGVLSLILVLLVAVLGLEWVVRTQIGLLVILVIALIDFFIGTCIPPSDDKLARGYHGYQGWVFAENMKPAFTEGEGFFSVFAVFFPAATGILAGANISGDLANAQTAIPKGTFLAIIISTIVYLLMAWSCGAVAVRHAAGPLLATALENATELGLGLEANATSVVAALTMNDSLDALEAGEVCQAAGNCTSGLLHSYQMMEMISAFGPLITAGIFAATLSSALASLVGAPKVFQAVCADRIFPGIFFFAKGYGKGNEPIPAYGLTAFIALCFIAVGELNVIALFISNIFLMAYALINYSCFDASLAKSPGWRPAFKYYSMWLSLVGSLMCLIIMFIIKWWVALFTFLLVAVLYVVVHYRKPDINWGSSTQAHVYRNALQSSLKLSSVLDHIKNYRPQILVMSGFPSHRPALIDFANTITKNQSLLVCGHVIVQAESQSVMSRSHHQNEKRAYAFLRRRKARAFYTSITANTFRFGAQSLMQSIGIGKLRPNTILIGFKNDWQKDNAENLIEYVNVVHDAFDLRYGVGILRISEGLHVEDDDSCDEEEDSENENYEPDTDVLGEAEVETKEESIPLSPVKQAEGESSSQLAKQKTSAHSTTFDRFSVKQKAGTVDVYWLFDDGGLTILLPYILSTKSQWSNTKLRVFSPGTKKHQLDHDQRHMATLLSKFRIDYSSVTILPDVGKKPRSQTRDEFDRLIEKWRLDEEAGETSETHPHKISEADLMSLKDKTNRHLRLKELLLENSSDATLIVMTLPMPRKSTVPASLYLAWIDTLSSGLPPILLLRGNQQSVLTYYS